MSVVLITHMKVHRPEVDRALRVFSDMQADVRANEAGTTGYQYLQADDDPTEFWVYEVFADDAAKDAHLGRHGHRRADFDAILAMPAVFHWVHEI